MIKPPVAQKKLVELVKHDTTRIDNYFWLNQPDDQEVIDYLNAENEYTSHMLKKTESLQEELYNEIVGRIKQTDISVPYFSNGYYYYTRYEEGKEYPVYCERKNPWKAKKK
ncbi:Dipeptidyl aminopeptidase BI [subsurface metagenome]